jgi:polysaccharide export outer membrane protein
MRVVRFIVLAVTAAVLAGCMQTGGPGIFAHDGAPPWRQDISPVAWPAFLRPGSGYAATPVPIGPAPVMAQPLAPQQMAPQPIGPQLVAQPVAMEGEPAYTLDSGDKLRVVVFGQDGLSASYSVDTAGRITMPLIGAVQARGMTPAGIQQAIAAKLKNGYVREPHVAVEVELYRPFFILGEVTNPGQYPYVANMTAEKAVAIAGGFAPRANKRTVELTRSAPGQQMKSDVPLTYPLRPGDTVVVKERWF